MCKKYKKLRAQGFVFRSKESKCIVSDEDEFIAAMQKSKKAANRKNKLLNFTIIPTNWEID